MSAQTYPKCSYRCPTTSSKRAAPPQTTAKRLPNHLQITTKPPQMIARITHKPVVQLSLKAPNHIKTAPKPPLAPAISGWRMSLGFQCPPCRRLAEAIESIGPENIAHGFRCPPAAGEPTRSEVRTEPDNSPGTQEAGSAVAGNPGTRESTHGKRSNRHSRIRS